MSTLKNWRKPQEKIRSTPSDRARITPEMISAKAYEIWETQGRPEGQSVQHWLQAESELQASQQPSLQLPPRG